MGRDRVEPTLMGMGPAPATRLVLKKMGPVTRRHRSHRGERGLRRAIPPSRRIRTRSRQGERQRRRNALGHPLTGTRLLLTLLLELRRRGQTRGLATAHRRRTGIAAIVETV
jgi:acetyl-CoA C-acetyltransferase